MQDLITFEFDYRPEDMPVEKDAKIFEAGEYPDKGVTIGEEELDAIVENFTEVPVKVEHTNSPLDPLGVVKKVWRQGKELLARLAFPKDLAAFLERRGVKSLSVALHKDPLRLAEVSLVLNPRVLSAAMFGERDSGARSIQNRQCRGEVSENMSASGRSEVPSPVQDHDTEIAELRFALRARDVEARLADLKAKGKIVPASEPYAREILLQGDEKITFRLRERDVASAESLGEGETTVAELFERFLEAQPKVITFGELSPATKASGAPLSAEDEELIARLGLTREQLEKYGN